MLRALVTGWRRVTLSVDAPRLSAANIKLEQVTAPEVKRLDVRASLALRELASFIGFSAPAALTSWVSVSATNIALLVGALNRYLRDNFGLSDLPSIEVGKPFNDQLDELIDELVLLTGKVEQDEAVMLDNLILRLEIFRDFVESVSFSDSQFLDIEPGYFDQAVISEDHALDYSTIAADQPLIVEDHALSFATVFSDAFGPLGDSQTILTGKGFFDAPALSEDHLFDFDAAYADAANLGEELALDYATVADDGFSVADTFSRDVVFVRGFSDAVAPSEELSWAAGKALDDAPTLSEALSYEGAKALSENLGMGDQDVLSILLPKTETTIVTDSLSRTVSFSRTFTDAFTVDDLISVAEQHVETKTNVFSFADDQILAVGKSLEDRPTVNETLALHVFEGAKALGGSTLNAAPLN